MRVRYNPEWRKLPGFTLATTQPRIDSDPAMIEAIARGAAKPTLYAHMNPDCARQVSRHP